MTPPWPEIFCHDAERKHPFAAAVEEYDRLMEFYQRCSYQLIEIPEVSIEKRVQIILSRAV